MVLAGVLVVAVVAGAAREVGADDHGDLTGEAGVLDLGHQEVDAGEQLGELADLVAVVVAGGIEPEQQTIVKAKEQEVILCKTSLSVYEATGRLYRLSL